LVSPLRYDVAIKSCLFIIADVNQVNSECQSFTSQNHEPSLFRHDCT
jgi:hypothetical protein